MKEMTTQEKVITINEIVKRFDKHVIPYQLCEVCHRPKNLIICEICKNYFHLKCLEIKKIPQKFQCENCKDFHINIPKSQQVNFNIHENLKNILKLDSTQSEVLNSFSNINNYKETRKIKKEMSSNSLVENISVKENINFERVIKPRKKRITNFEDITKLERKDLLAFENNEIHYKKRKIRVSRIHNMDMREYYDKIENEINLDEVDWERQELKKVYSASENKLSQIQIDNYLRRARIFWNYRNLNVENELCADFFDDLDEYIKDNKINFYFKSHKINEKVDALKKFLKNGITFDIHLDEIALKILHICQYKDNVALLFMMKGMNPFMEGINILNILKILEIEEGFKSDVVFFKKEILSILSDDEI